MNLFLENDYRKIVRALVVRERTLGKKLTLESLAQVLRVQHPYLSKVMNSKAHLSAEQMFRLCRHFKLSVDEARFLKLLLSHERCGDAEMKGELELEILEIQKKHRKIKNQVSAVEVKSASIDYSAYYLNPNVQLVHLFLTIPRYAHSPPAIAKSMGVPLAAVNQAIEALVKLRIVEVGARGLRVVVQNMHLADDSPLCRPQQALMRLRSADRTQGGYSENDVVFSVCFSADAKARERVRELFFKFLKRVEATVKPAPSEQVFQMNFDLLSWQEGT